MKLILKDLDMNVEQILANRGLDERGRVQQYIDSEVLRLCEPYVPRDIGTLIESGILCTDVGSGVVQYNTPYARLWYYTPARFQGAPKRGNYWFERMKNEGGAQSILAGAARIAGGRTG